MAKIFFENTGDEAEVADGESIVEACEEVGIPFACTEGICGTCVIEVVKGMENLSEFTEAERDFLGEPNGERLACQCKMQGPFVTIKF